MQFKKLFKNAKTTLSNALEQKYKAITRIDDPNQILDEKAYQERKSKILGIPPKSKQIEEEDKRMEVPLLFYKGTKTIKQLQKDEMDESSSYESNFKTDSSMQDYDMNKESDSDNDNGLGVFAVRSSKGSETKAKSPELKKEKEEPSPNGRT